MEATGLRALIAERIERLGPMTFATFMGLSLYHPEHGFYARTARPTGRTGHFFTSVDVGPLFGLLLAEQFAEMWALLGRPPAIDLVEAGASNGQLSRDVLDACASRHPAFYAAARSHLVEESAAARAVHAETLGPHAHKCSSGDRLPDAVHGVIFANELLDALPCHIVTMTEDNELREIAVDLDGNELVERAIPPTTPELAAYLAGAGVELQPGWRAEINLASVGWVRDAARRLGRGFLVLIDYGHPAAELYSSTHAAGTLTTFRRHRASAAGERPQIWINEPGEHDLTSHVDLTSIEKAAAAEGLDLLGRLDQTYFLLGLAAPDLFADSTGAGMGSLKNRLALKTLLLPGGLGSVQKVLLFGRDVGTPRLRGCAMGARLT
jgi:SAM-dependent MidA family methyltransferase